MYWLIDEARVALVALAIIVAPYLCCRVAGAFEHEEVVSASLAIGWIEVSGPRQRTVAASSQHP